MSAAAADPGRAQPASSRRTLGLRSRVAFLVLVLVGLVAATYAFVLLPEIRERMRAEEEDKVELYAMMIAEQMEDTLLAALEQLEEVASSPELATMEPAILDATIRQLDRTTPFYLFFMVLDDQGRIVSRPSKPVRVGGDRSGKAYFARAMQTGATHVADVGVSTAGNLTLVAGAPIRRGDRTVGVLAGSLGLMDRNSAFYDSVVQPSRPWPVELYLVSASGRPLAASLSDDALATGVSPSANGAAHRDLLERAAGDIDDDRGWLVARSRIEPIGWTTLVRVPTSYIDREVAAITERFVVVGAILLATMLIIGVAVAEALARPLSRLTAAMARYGREGVADPIDPGGPGETRDAIVAFNYMIEERERAVEQREQLEGQLVQSQKLQTVGTLAGGIAHDFNNFLTPILLGGHRLASKLPAGDLRRELADGIVTSAEGARELVSRMLRFSRTTEGKRVAEDLAVVIEQSLHLVKVAIPRGVELRADVDEDAGCARVDLVQIQQVILNLTGNAIAAMGEGDGVLGVSLRRSRDHRELVIEVTDTGDGMDRDALERIFEPFYTTKPPGEGTGLGLPVVKGIVADHGGRIEVESTPGDGTRFRIHLPRVEATDAASSAPVEGRPRGRALVVDDDAPVARAAAFLLEELGFEVEIETDSEAAVEHAGGDFDLVLSDQSMPGLSGLEVARAIRRRRPQQPILLMTGRPDVGLEEGCQELGLPDPVAKPLVPRQLAAAIDAAMASRQRSRTGPRLPPT